MKKIISALLAVTIIFTFSVFAQARLVGDVNHDKETNSADALEVLCYSVGKTTEIDKAAANVNGDTNIDSADALCILQISVGSYKGELEIPDEPALVTSFKEDKVDSILKTGKFTLTTTVVDGESSVPTTIAIKGNDLCADLKYSSMNLRMLLLDGNCYIILPTLKVYSKTNTVPSFSITSTAKETYVKSEYVDIGGKTYVREVYTYDDGSTRNYYFLNGEWKALETTDKDGKTSTQSISGLSATVDESKFSLKGYYEVDLNKYL